MSNNVRNQRDIRRATLAIAFVALWVVAIVARAPAARALVLTGGPVTSPPGGGSCAITGTVGSGDGLTMNCTVTSLDYFTDVYFGIANNGSANGLAMDGSAPTGFEIFRYSSNTDSSIVYISTTTIDDVIGSSTEPVNTRLVLTLTEGTGDVFDTGGTPANNANGDIQKLFRITSSTFAIHVTVSSNVLEIPTFGLSYSNVFDPTHTPASGKQSQTHIEFGYYYNECHPPNAADRGMLTSSSQPVPAECLAAPGEAGIVLSNMNFDLRWQTDGDLVLTNPSGLPIWRSDTGGEGVEVCFQSDGNLVIRDAASNAVFASDTADDENNGNGGMRMTLDDTCNLTIADNQSQVLFQTETNCASLPFTPTPTLTFTPSPTWTATATRTITPTARPTETVTQTATPSPTSTFTITVTASPTSTPTSTATSSPAPTDSPTSSPTPTPVDSATPTSSPTAPSTATPTVTESPTFTITPTAVDSTTPTASATTTGNSTETTTVTPTQTATVTPTPTATLEEVSPEPTNTETPMSSASRARLFARGGTLGT